MINLGKIFADTLAKYPKAAGTLAYNTAVRSIGIRNEGIEHRIEVFGLDNIADEYVTYRKDCIKALNKMKRQRSANKINIFNLDFTMDEYFIQIALWTAYNRAVVRELNVRFKKRAKEQIAPRKQ